MKSLITPLDAVPALFAGRKIYQGGRLGVQGLRSLYVSGRRLPSAQELKLIQRSGESLLIGSSLLGTKYIGEKLVTKYYQSRDRTQSYQQSERLGTTTTRIPGAKRLRSQTKTSRRTVLSGDARRRTTYCKRHKQYDFCEKYNIRK